MGMSERNDLKKYGIVKGRLQINLRCKGEGGGGGGAGRGEETRGVSGTL